MEEQLLQAIGLASGGPQAGQDYRLIQEALAYLEQVKENREQIWSVAWNIFAERDESTSRPARSQNQRLFCLNLVTLFLEDGVQKTNDPAAAVAFLQSSALQHFDHEFVAGRGEEGLSFMMNKFAQLLSNLLIQTYGLPPPFTLLPSLLGRMRSSASSSSSPHALNPMATDMVLRLLHEVSVNLGSDATLRAVRSRERIARDTAIRDEIRASHAMDIATTVWKVIEEGLARVARLGNQPASSTTLDEQGWSLAKTIEVTCEAITVIGDYASWIDISLIVTPQTISLLYGSLQQRITSLRMAATDALLEIVSKGMKAEDKVEMLRVLNLTSTISQLEKESRHIKGQGEMEDEAVTFREHLARLTNGVALEFAKVLESTTSSDAVREAADKMLLAHLSLVLDFLTDEWDEMADAVLPCVSVTLSIYKRLKRIDKTAASAPAAGISYSPDKAAFLARLMDVLLVKMKFDDEQQWNGGAGASQEGSDEGDESDEEEIARFLQLRKQLQQCAAAIAGIDESLFTGPTQQLILETLQACDAFLSNTGPPVSWQRAELALYSLHFCGEVYSTSQGQTKVGVNASSFVHLPPDTTKAMRNKPSDGFLLALTLNPLGELVQRLFQCNVSAFRHPAVQLQYFECCVRYAAFFSARPDSLGDALSPFLDWRGIHQQRASVRHRIDYLFLRFVRETKDHFQPDYVRGILESIQDRLVVTAKLPAVEPNEDPLEQAIKDGFEHQMNLFEACGVLLRILKNGTNDQMLLLKALIEPLSKQLSEATRRYEMDKNDLQSVLQVHHLFFALSNVAKGFPELNGAALTRQAATPSWMLVFKDITEQILSTLAVGNLNNYRIIRDAARGAFSRMVATTGLVVLPYIPSLLNALLSQLSSNELMDFLSFLGLVVNKYKADVDGVMEELFTPVLERTFFFLNQEVAGTDDQVQRQQVIRGYVGFLSMLIGVNLDGVLRSNRNQPQLETILQSLVFYAGNTEPSCVRQIFNIFSRLVLLWGGSSDPAKGAGSNGSALAKTAVERPLPGFENFIYKTLVGLIFEIPGKPTFDFADAQTQIALTEICNLAKAIYTQRGQEFIDFLTGVYFPGINCPANLANDFVQGLQTHDTKHFRKHLENFIVRSRG